VTRLVATKLAVTTEPSSTTSSGTAFNRQPVIQLLAADGESVPQAGVSITAAIASGNGALAGTTTVQTDASGSATFTDLSITGIVGVRTLSFNAVGLTATASASIDVTAGAASRLAIATIGNQMADVPFSVTITLVDASGNAALNSGASGTVTLSRQDGTGVLGGVTSATIAGGATSVAISGVTYGIIESGVTLLATGGGAGSSVAGKTGTSNAFSVTPDTSTHSYSTDFPLSEVPISEGGRWINGQTDGIDWSDVFTTPGHAYGNQTGASFTDGTALLRGTWNADQAVSATVYRPQPLDDNCYPEVELRLRSTISPKNNQGYEVSFKATDTDQAYLIIVRWNGALGDFSYIANLHGAQYGVTGGDNVRATILGNTITVYKNEVMMASADIHGEDGTLPPITTGSPGIGFNLENALESCRGTNSLYGFSHFSAVDKITAP